MNNEYDINPEIPEIPKPIKPERSTIEIWPGRPRKSTPVPLEGPGIPVRETDVESTPPTPQTQSGGSGRGGSGSKQPPSSSDPFDFSLGRSGKPGKPDFPSVDEISSYWSFRNKSEFGIAVSNRGLDLYAEAITNKVPSIPYDKARNIAENFAVQHQVHHFLVDRAVETMEALTGDSLWLPMQKNFASNKYGYSPLEVSLSCAYARRYVTNATSVTGFNVLLALQPSGYQLCNSDGKKIKTNGGPVTHAQALSALLSGYAQRTDTPQSRIIGLHGLMLFKNHIDGTNGDLYFSVNGNKVKIQVFYSK